MESKDYKYLLSLKSSNENEEQIIEILKGQGNIKEYIIQAIASFEQGKSIENIENKLKNMELILEEINRNTGM